MDELIKKKKKSNLKKIILGSFLGILIGSILGTSIAMFSYNSSSTNGKLVVGDIYMKYKETNNINIENAMPSTTYINNQYFEFEVTGKNTTIDKDIIYDIVLAHGDEPNDTNRNIRIKDELIRFRLVRVENNTETEIFNDKSYSTINNTRIHKEIISKNTTNEITHKYRLYAWIANETKIGNTADADYTLENWNKVFASVKVNVTGDFSDKKVQGVLYDIVKTDTINDSNIDGNGTPIHFYEVNGTDNGNGKFVRSTTTSDAYPIYYYRGNVDNNNVIFANKCWKIVRTTETGGTKMIYNGDIKSKYEKIDLSNNQYTIESNQGGWTYDSTDNSWNVSCLNCSLQLIFRVPTGNNYTMKLTGKFGSNGGGGFQFFKDNQSVFGGGGSSNDDLDYSYFYGNLTSDNIIKFTLSAGFYGNDPQPATIKIKMIGSGEYLGEGCDNSGVESIIKQYPFNSKTNSIAYTGYNYGDVLEFHEGNKSGIYGHSVIYSNGKYSLTGDTGTKNNNRHYICDDDDCKKVRYYYHNSSYVILENGDTIEDALRKMISESNNTSKSSIHEEIDNWYNENIKTSYEKYVEDTNWCDDKSIASLGGWDPNGTIHSDSYLEYALIFNANVRYNQSYFANDENNIIKTNSPLLKCSNPNDIMSIANKKLDNPIALLSVDEASLAGLVNETSNSFNYLNSRIGYWLLNPSDVSIGAGVISTGYNGEIFLDLSAASEIGVRPALSLKHGTLVYDGDGTIDNPYIVGTSR